MRGGNYYAFFMASGKISTYFPALYFKQPYKQSTHSTKKTLINAGKAFQ